MKQSLALRETNFLRVPSYLWGISRIMDIEGNMDSFYVASNGSEADASSIARDWYVIGDDLRFAIDKEWRVVSSSR